MKRLNTLLLFSVILIGAGCCVLPPEPPTAAPVTTANPTRPFAATVFPTATPSATPLPSAAPTQVIPTTEPQLTLSSSAFDSGAEIPLRHAQRTFEAPGGWTVTCPGENISPPLSWTNVPPGTESLAIVCLDHIDMCEKCEPLAPQDRAWPHWGIYNIAPTSRDLPVGQPAEPSLPDDVVQVVNGYGEVGYGGPCPPPGHTHTYVFTLYALDIKLDLPEGIGVEDLVAAMEGYILAHADLQGTFLGR